MRIGTNILLIDGYCYQSYNWNKLRPLGELQNVVDSLEEYECDEIAIIRPIRQNDSLSSFEKDIKVLQRLTSMTPLSFGGGLRKQKHIDMLHGLPIERLIFSSPFIGQNYKLIEYAIKLYGHQAIQCLLPFELIHNSNAKIFLSNQNNFITIKDVNFKNINKLANEIILFDTYNEGGYDTFNLSILKQIPLLKSKLLLSGGIGKTVVNSAKKEDIASVIIDNKTLHKEFSIKGYKNA